MKTFYKQLKIEDDAIVELLIDFEIKNNVVVIDDYRYDDEVTINVFKPIFINGVEEYDEVEETLYVDEDDIIDYLEEDFLNDLANKNYDVDEETKIKFD